jgi:hypothetical protein
MNHSISVPPAALPIGGNRPVRGTQLLVEHMGAVIKRPSLVAIEIAWRWVAALPILLVFWSQVQRILASFPLAASGFNSIDAQNPWVAVVQLEGVWSYYMPHVAAVLRWLVPTGALFWALVAGLGRNLLLMRMDRRLPFRPVALIGLQAGWMALLALTVWGWVHSIQWVAATHIAAGAGEPDLIGYAMWTIFLTLGFFTAWALASWAFSIAPLLVLLEGCSALSSLGRSLKLGKGFTSKLVEINLVMGIVEIALIVLAMVFSAAPLPFSDELSGGALHSVLGGSVVFFVVANDYFQVVRLKAFTEFWKLFRGPALSN